MLQSEPSHSTEHVGQQAHGFHRIIRNAFPRKTRQTWHTPSSSDDEHDDGKDALNTVTCQTSASEPLPLAASSAANSDASMVLKFD